MQEAKGESRARARDRVLLLLKSKGMLSAAQLAQRLAITTMAVRQHLATLEEEGLVSHFAERRKVGRPARIWRLEQKADAHFPNGHANLAIELIDAARAAFGERGLENLIGERARMQARAYRERIPERDSSIEKRVAALTTIRRREGYMAEWSRQRDGSLLLIENHCPILAAASACEALCSHELTLFQSVLGRDVKIERKESILDGARRCVYQITPQGARAERKPARTDRRLSGPS